MINPKELRLGNYVQDRGGKTIRIDFMEHVQEGYSTKFGQVVSDEFHPLTEWTDHAEPIPLTEDILLKCGAVKVVEKQYNLFGMRLHLHGSSFIEYVHEIEIKSFHHLQNVYFFTRGKELKINL